MAEETSIWKREIRLGRRPRLDEAVEEAMKTDTAPHAVGETQTTPELSVGKQSLWKKEFHIGSAPGDNPSFWKKEIRLVAPRKAATEAPAFTEEPPAPS